MCNGCAMTQSPSGVLETKLSNCYQCKNPRYTTGALVRGNANTVAFLAVTTKNPIVLRLSQRTPSLQASSSKSTCELSLH